MDADPEKSEESSERSPIRDAPPEADETSPQVAVRLLSPGTDAQWKAIFYDTIQPRALDLQEVRVDKIHKSKMLEKKAERKDPPDSQTRDWFSEEMMTLETRAYLLDKLLPTLIPGVEKLLMVAERKKVVEMEESEPCTFNPLIFLGEYLMRHNPAYDIPAIPNPYGMKVVADEMKTHVPETTMHKLAQMKMLVKEKRGQREQVEKIKAHVKDMRKEALSMQFKEWTMDFTRQIPLMLVTKRGEYVGIHDQPNVITMGVLASSPSLPLPDQMIMAQVKKGVKITKAKVKDLEITRLIPLHLVKIFVHNVDERQLKVKLATGQIYYLQLCTPKGDNFLFERWIRLAYMLHEASGRISAPVSFTSKESGLHTIRTSASLRATSEKVAVKPSKRVTISGVIGPSGKSVPEEKKEEEEAGNPELHPLDNLRMDAGSSAAAMMGTDTDRPPPQFCLC
ncbi:uncharacterized protein LOC133363936 isoform X2 [Rhineura floridana]|uniref:uncharacterized protein LOC133363936 isoform X2 n=1 Tax=Rhineura floridana TaxID=261503 RepID=UPI002AC87352|nr:uncharacterized protein LOC133363936 isoform X2 [Rhineura floridana]